MRKANSGDSKAGGNQVWQKSCNCKSIGMRAHTVRFISFKLMIIGLWGLLLAIVLPAHAEIGLCEKLFSQEVYATLLDQNADRNPYVLESDRGPQYHDPTSKDFQRMRARGWSFMRTRAPYPDKALSAPSSGSSTRQQLSSSTEAPELLVTSLRFQYDNMLVDRNYECQEGWGKFSVITETRNMKTGEITTGKYHWQSDSPAKRLLLQAKQAYYDKILKERAQDLQGDKFEHIKAEDGLLPLITQEYFVVVERGGNGELRPRGLFRIANAQNQIALPLELAAQKAPQRQSLPEPFVDRSIGQAQVSEPQARSDAQGGAQAQKQDPLQLQIQTWSQAQSSGAHGHQAASQGGEKSGEKSGETAPSLPVKKIEIGNLWSDHNREQKDASVRPYIDLAWYVYAQRLFDRSSQQVEVMGRSAGDVMKWVTQHFQFNVVGPHAAEGDFVLSMQVQETLPKQKQNAESAPNVHPNAKQVYPYFPQ